MLATIRPDSWDLPLFLHVLGATLLFGSTAAVAVVGFAGWRRRGDVLLLSRIMVATFLLAIVPSWILMRVCAQWIDNKEFPSHEPGWVGVGYPVSEGGGVFLIVVGILAWLSVRRQGSPRLAFAGAVLASIVLIALGVAWFAMSAKP